MIYNGIHPDADHSHYSWKSLGIEVWACDHSLVIGWYTLVIWKQLDCGICVFF